MTDNEFAPPTPPGQPRPPQSQGFHAAPPPGPAPTAPPSPQTPPRKRAPRWVLWFGLFAAVVILVGVVWAGVLMFLDSRTAPADADATGDMHALSVVEGMCIEAVSPDGAVSTVTVVACDAPHEGQVVAATDLPVEVFPGTEGLRAQAEEYCEPRFPRDLPEGASSTMWLPTEDSWRRGDRTVSCLVVTAEPATESYVDNPVSDEDSTTQTQTA